MDEQHIVDTVEKNRVIGFIEAVNESGIYGWAYDNKNLSQPAVMLFHIDGEFISNVDCRSYRADVASAGHPRHEVGFSARIPQSYFDGLEHTYFFTTADGQDVSLGTLRLPNLPVQTFRFDTYFDPDFYRKYYGAAPDMNVPQAYLDWANGEHLEPRHPNSEALLAELEDRLGALPNDFTPGLYRLLNHDIAREIESNWEAAVHYIQNGRAERRNYKFTQNSFVSELYFGGLAPPAANLEAFVLENNSRLYTSLQDLLSRNGITSDAFLKFLNVSDYVADKPDLGLKTKLQCIKHFAEIGRRDCSPLSFDHYFEHGFLTEIDPSYASLAASDAYLRWVNVGVLASTPPNHSAFLAGLGLTDISDFPAAFNYDLYLAKNPDLRPVLSNRWHGLRHFIEQGLAEGREGCPISDSCCDIYRAVADRLAVAGQLQSARRIYETLLSQDARNVLGNRHYGDCLLRLDEFFLAARVYEQTIAGGKDNIWTHLNLVVCYVKLGRWSDACRVAHLISKARPGDRALQRRHREVMRDAYNAIAAEANWLANNKFYAQARQRLAQACQILTAPMTDVMTQPSVSQSPVRSIAIIADLGLPQCKFYRVDQKIEQITAAGIECKMIDYRGDIFKFVRGSLWTDAFIFYRVPATPDVMWSIRLLRNAGIPIFFEIDDLMFDDARFPDSFESYGGQISHDLYATLITGSVSLAAAMSVCDYAIASTSPLAEAMRPLSIGKKAFVHRNSLSSAHQKSLGSSRLPADRRTIRLFYGSGTKAHNEDFELHLAGPLARLFAKWGDRLQLFVMGYLTLPRALRPFHHQITIHDPVWELPAYWNVLREMDIAIAVLKPGLIADCKSEIKWLEAAMLGVPSVVTATQTYVEVIENGKTGLLVDDSADWFTQLDDLIGDAAKRRAIGAAAKSAVLERYSIEQMSANLRAVFDSITVLPPAARKRILIVNVFYPPQSIGGATRVVADNVGDLRANYGDAFELQIFTTMEGGAEAYVPLTYVMDGVRVTAVPTPLDPDIDQKVWDDKMAGFFERVLERFEPDLIHFHCIQRITVSVCEAARRRSIPYVVTVHDGWWISDEQFLMDQSGNSSMYDFADPLREFGSGDGNRLQRMKIKQEYLASAERVLAVSEPFAEIYRGCGFSNVIAIPNGVSKLEVLPRTKSPTGRVRLAHIGGASFHKGYNLVRSALFRGGYENLELLVIDHSMDFGAERRAIWGRTPVTFRGKVPQSKVAQLYCEVDVLLAPSVWPESYGLVAREALLAGCWVVASDRGAIGQDVSTENGFVVDVSSTAELSAVLTAIDSDPSRYIASPSSIAKLRTAADQADDLAGLYRSLAENLSSATMVPSQSSSTPNKRRNGSKVIN